MKFEQQSNKSYSKVTIITMYFLLNYGYIKLLFNNILIDYLQYILLAVAIMICIYKSSKLTNFRIDSISIMLLILSIWIMSTKFYSISTLYLKSKLTNYFIALLFLVLVKSLMKSISIKEFIYDLLKYIYKCNLIVIGLFTIINFSSFITVINQGQRIGNASINPIWIARLCAETILCILFLQKENIQKEKKKIINFILIIGLIGVIFVSGSKGPILALGLSWIYYIYISHKNKFNLKFVRQILIFLLIIVVVLFLLNNFKYLDFIKLRFSLDSIFVNAKGYRVERYDFTWEMIKEKILLGYGFGSWPILYRGVDYIDYPHNILLEFWVETGIIGLSAFIIIVILALKGVSKANSSIQMVATFFILSLIMAMFSGSISEGNRGIYTYLGMISAIKSLERQELDGD